ncbi:hypothetical protein YTPLAS18_37600 [Nitrospira sp.]|nr:hypothetical protein YTPLAS18_37600 [Nitrospira sp.]
MPLTPEEWVRLRLLQFMVRRGGTLSEDETVLMDSGILRLDQHLGKLLALGYIQRDAGSGHYSVTEAGRMEHARLVKESMDFRE